MELKRCRRKNSYKQHIDPTKFNKGKKENIDKV